MVGVLARLDLTIGGRGEEQVAKTRAAFLANPAITLPPLCPSAMEERDIQSPFGGVDGGWFAVRNPGELLTVEALSESSKY